MTTMNLISAEEFLTRAELPPPPRTFEERQYARRRAEERFDSRTGKPLPPRVERKNLYAAVFTYEDEIAGLVIRVRTRHCEIQFVDNAAQPSFSPTVVITGEHGSMLLALADLCNEDHAPIEVRIASLESKRMDLSWISGGITETGSR